MSALSWLCVAAVAVLLGLHLVAEAGGARTWRAVTKVGASLGFVCLALSLGVAGAFDRLVLAGLLLSLLGDACLLSDRRSLFLGGLAAFLLAHLSYAAAFGTRGAPPAWPMVPLGATLGLVLRWLWPHLGELRGPVVAYTLAIGAMVWLAMGMVPAVKVGAVLFFLSDLLVARDRFVAPGLRNRLVGLPLYYAAQALLASAVGG
jgi:uncharacterized membrane protein YhhN